MTTYAFRFWTWLVSSPERRATFPNGLELICCRMWPKPASCSSSASALWIASVVRAQIARRMPFGGRHIIGIETSITGYRSDCMRIAVESFLPRRLVKQCAHLMYASIFFILDQDRDNGSDDGTFIGRNGPAVFASEGLDTSKNAINADLVDRFAAYSTSYRCRIHVSFEFTSGLPGRHKHRQHRHR